MMGLPDGWVTDVPGLSRPQQLKALGNGVVPLQAALALRMLLGGGIMDTDDAGLLPTPRAEERQQRNSRDDYKALSLLAAEGLLPTPMTINRTSQRAQTGRPTSGPQRGGASYGLEDVLLPTPNTMDSLPPKTPEQIMAHREDGKGGDFNLREVVLYEMNGRLTR